MNEINVTTTATTALNWNPATERKNNGPATQGARDGATGSSGLAGTMAGRTGQEAPPTNRARRHILRALVVVVCVGNALALYQWWNYSRTWIRTDNAYITAHVHQISARVAGTVSEVLAQDNQFVKAGAMIARLDRRDFEMRRQQAAAQLAQAHAQSSQAQAQIAQAQAQVARESAQAGKAAKDLERAQALATGSTGAISKQELDNAQAAFNTAAAGREAAKSALASAQAMALAAQAQEQAAQVGLQDAELQLSYTDVLAPATGRIGRKSLEVGNRVQPGQALLALVEPEVWVVANFKETQLAHLRPGAPVRLAVDAFPGRIFSGHVESVAPASGAQFALLPPDNATGNFTKIVQRVPVKIVLDHPSVTDSVDLAAGMSVMVEVRRTPARGG